MTLRPILSEPCQVSPPRTNYDVEVRDENQREIAGKSVQLSQVIVRERDPYNQGKARSHQFSDEVAIPFDKIGMDVPVVRYPCRISEAEGPPRQVHSADLTARHSHPKGNTRRSKNPRQADNKPVSKKQTRIQFRQKTSREKN